ncbi:conserved domain protein [Streptococcus parauberis NCFD 2020]|uniref:Conserved domain protein n=1 Tax=Streptococcus parauberis NCFD 2020 TaxID=873447 RepID=F1Z1Y2_9STRE|nr:conserved domain protein [Streptococcus parauberis NCFD 2020]
MLTIENLTYSFPGSNPIFADIDLIVNDMESVLISGYSRCGKSSLAIYLLY